MPGISGTRSSYASARTGKRIRVLHKDTTRAETATAPIPHTKLVPFAYTEPMTGGPASMPVTPIAATNVNASEPCRAATT